MSAPGRSMMTGTTEARLESLDSSARVDFASTHVCTHAKLPCFSHTLVDLRSPYTVARSKVYTTTPFY